MAADLNSQIANELSNLPLDDKQRVLAYVRSLKALPKGTSPAHLMKYAGTISREDEEAMMKAIEEGCGQVDPNEW